VGRRNTDKLEVSEQLVVADKLTLTLVNLDLDGALEVGGRREDLRLLGGDGGVAVDQAGENTTEGLNTKGQRCNVEQKKVSDLASKDSTLDGSTDSDSLVRVDRLGGIAAEDALDGLGNLGHASHTANENDLGDLLWLEIGVLESLANRVNSAADQGVHHLLKLGAGELGVDVLGSGCVGGDEGQVDVGLRRGGQLDLGLLGSLADTLDGHAVAVQIDALFLLELLDEVANKSDVEILATEMSVAVGRLDLKDAVLDLEDGDIESTTTEIVDGDNGVGSLVETVGKGGGGRLVDDTQDVQSSNHTGVLGGLTLGVVEVGGDGDDGVLDILAHVGLGRLLHLSEDKATDLRGRVLLALGLEPGIAVGVLDDFIGHLLDVTLDLGVGELAADEALSSEESVLRVDDCLALGSDTDKTLTLLGETDDGWCRAATCDG
jgi:hypothetical protein